MITINVVRRDEHIEPLKALGADYVINSEKEDVGIKAKEFIPVCTINNELFIIVIVINFDSGWSEVCHWTHFRKIRGRSVEGIGRQRHLSYFWFYCWANNGNSRSHCHC